MCFLVDLFFLIELFILIDFLHEAAHNGVSFCENSTVMGDKWRKNSVCTIIICTSNGKII